jgi:hypothetical protein
MMLLLYHDYHSFASPDSKGGALKSEVHPSHLWRYTLSSRCIMEMRSLTTTNGDEDGFRASGIQMRRE